ncbi:hypothetical protein BDF20DRAFT_811323 [Mycotypha africana]|uniref:uncharacterized protein n=1 Tax=Mycotypha africana TaxID=64632 RepID=UPI002300C3A3|nr:uncharacterized protein BDF20DRAFT_811323 [Mycotypha africana]KAI8991430.1 hypothetical protein BDF20DRAFT_811323 [Mycotypha africana]
MRSIDIIYSEFCKRQEDAVLKLQELEQHPQVQEFLIRCKEQMQGKTTSWDLGSLLIKPVQRVLKYPLLLRELHSLTPNTHQDYENLTAAVKEIQEVADNINEIKRRKDIVERIVGDKKRTDLSVVHGINKKLSRRAQKLKQATGFAVEPTHDVKFETLYVKFEEQQELVRQLARDVQGWVRHVKIGFENLQQLACSMESIYGSWGGVRVKRLTGISEFSKMAAQLSTSLARELDNDVRGYIYSRIDEFLKIFENPAQVIHKRSMKMIDYDRVRDMKMKGDVPDKALQESADAYVSINAQLVDELPRFFALTAKYFEFMTGSLALVQMKFYKRMQKEWRKLVQQNLGLEVAQTYEAIIKDYMSHLESVDNAASQIAILQRDNRYSNSIRNTSPINSGYSTTPSSTHRRTNTASQSVATDVVDANAVDTQLEDRSKDFNCIVLYDFETHEEDKLDVKRGTILRINQDEDYIDPDWWYGTSLDDFRSGWIPINYCKKI